MFESLQKRTVIVTGASRGIGLGIAKRYGQAGLNVLVVSRSLSDAEQVARDIGPHASGFAADVSQEDACLAMVQAAVERYGSVDVLAANAGIFPSARLGDMSVEDFDHVINTNLRSTFLSTKAVLPVMKANGFGRIVLTSSITGPITGYPGWSHYAASKAGQLGFMRTAAIELAAHGITINAVMPGNILTEGLAGMGEQYQAEMAASIPLRRLGSVEDIANAVLFFSTREAGFITGQTLVIDGGQVLPESSAALG
ncbi:3-oxoacyl-ACP reductase FabG [Pseudomonas turukhanskensis]|uniref:3-oxoacyl-(ACP) reductase n=1 Tax=Pseudomonas turukhanskensis TaxID=1806536 RepID=A0A9W6NIJ0_9PSED|nr:3-oxoacyl-ACP reductase FabG [Pseudomonas turukhanskensis]GLK91990.1 3-oxoacyl-(ACP) reductase [Pseudomonas turukhanskensis]